MKNISRATNILMLLLIIFFLPSLAFAGTYWVSPSGTATWANAQSATPLSGASCCSLGTANSNASAGDTIYLRAGTYGIQIAPGASGLSGNIITYQAHTGEYPVINNVGIGIDLDGRDYIKIDGIEVSNTTHSLVRMIRGANYNEIVNCTLHDCLAAGNGGINIWTIGANASTKNTHNWIHNNTIYRAGHIDPTNCNDDSNLMKIGVGGSDFLSNNNTIEDNVMYAGGHHVIQINSKNNIVRNNVFHNEGWMTPVPVVCTLCTDATGKYGNRNQAMDDGESNLIENNRYGHAGIPSDGNGATGIGCGGRYNIIRYNFVFANQGPGIYLRYGTDYDGDYTHVYNNTIYYNGHIGCNVDNLRKDEQDYGIAIHRIVDFVAIKNNLLYNNFNQAQEIYCINGSGAPYNCGNKNLTFGGNWLTIADGDPLFVDADLSDPTSTTKPDLSLKSGSGAIDGGTYLTQAYGAGSNSTTLVVDDALYFQDGSWGSSNSAIDGDYISIGTVTNTVQISSINYSTETITLASAMTWSDNANIWLYKDSTGRIVLDGQAPDIGAYELVSGSPPTNLRLISP
ncbi:MAG: hypothetical protein LWX54_16910 [Deltaproteobacteria bacterium]|jgi:hypothetical protein|nr:hypothetical protein [Deltaproteobacteria bacterium]